MHARRRSPGNGYRSSSMGLGVGASGISSENSARGHGYYNSEYRSFNNRGFGRGQAGRYKSFQQPPQPPQVPQRGDILMEAGRLAAEYLVSKGLLPPNSLPVKWQNGSFRKQVGEYQEFRQQEDLMPDSRASGHARAGSNSDFDTGSGRRRYSDDFNSRNQMRGRRRGEYYRSYSSEWSREYGRSGSWSDRNNRVSPEMEGKDDTASEQRESNQHVDSVIDEKEKSASSMMEVRSAESAGIESGPEENNLAGNKGPKESSSDVKDTTDSDHFEGSEKLKTINLENIEEKNNDCSETEKQSNPDNAPAEECGVTSKAPSETITDLARLCKFAKVPTRTRSALTSRNSKIDRALNNEEQKNPDYQLSRGPEVLVHNDSLEISAARPLSCDTTQDYMGITSDITEEAPAQSAEDGCNTEPGGSHGKNLGSPSTPDEALMHENENEYSNRLTTFGRSSSVKERGEKRTAEDDDVKVAAKKPKEWLSSLVAEAETQMAPSKRTENPMGHQAVREYPDQQTIPAVTQDSVANGLDFPGTDLEPCPKYTQEKRLFPGSFKICDLNLMEASNVNDSRRGDPGDMYPPIMNIKNEGMPVDIDLSMSNSNMASEYGRHTRNSKEIEVIDLDNDSSPEHREFDKPQGKMESSFAAIEGLPSHGSGAGDITDVQDNYDGLTISEFLETFTNCSSATEDITPLENAMGLHNGEGTLGDDDSIYMSLDEIPLSFIPAWQQPTPQEYEKPF